MVACTFLEASSSTERTTALSCDSRGRLVFHNVTGYLSITNFIAGEAKACLEQAHTGHNRPGSWQGSLLYTYRIIVHEGTAMLCCYAVQASAFVPRTASQRDVSGT